MKQRGVGFKCAFLSIYTPQDHMLILTTEKFVLTFQETIDEGIYNINKRTLNNNIEN